MKPKTNNTLNPLKKLLKAIAEKEIEIHIFFLIVYLKEMRFLHRIFERVEVVKILWQKEGWGLRLCLPS